MVSMGPSQRNDATQSFDKRFWDAAEQFRGNSALTIQESFLGKFPRTEAQKRGEFYTPGYIGRFLTEVIEPYHRCN